MITFIKDHREEYSVEAICRVLPIARSIARQVIAKQSAERVFHHQMIQREPPKASFRAQNDAELRIKIRASWEESGRRYGR